MRCDETNYIKRLKKGKEDALEFIVDKYLGLVKSAVYKVLSPLERDGIIDECINDIFQSIGKKTEKDGVKLNIESISKTPVSFTLDYSQEISKELQEKWFTADVLIDRVKDDLGNVYESTGSITNQGDQGTYAGNSMSNFGKLDPNATKLIITHKVRLSNDSHPSSTDKNGNLIDLSPTIDENHPKRGEITFDDIVIDLEK